jgi:hypothetical protein
MAAMVGAMFGGVRVDRHAAHWVEHASRGRVVMMIVMLYRHRDTLPSIPPGGI